MSLGSSNNSSNNNSNGAFIFSTANLDGIPVPNVDSTKPSTVVQIKVQNGKPLRLKYNNLIFDWNIYILILIYTE